MKKRPLHPWEKKAAEKAAREAKRAKLLAEAKSLVDRARMAWDAAQCLSVELDTTRHQWTIGPHARDTGKPHHSNSDSLLVTLLCSECGDHVHAEFTGAALAAHNKAHGECTPAKRSAAAERRAFYRGVGCQITRNEFTETVK